ncbi:MAG TPA: hypothetical protein VGM88_09230 [Kofleriaceae bacterium]
MGYNAGGFGTMTFPSSAALDAWRDTVIRHGAYGDWVNELTEASYLPEESVGDRLGALADEDDPGGTRVQQIGVDGLTVVLTYDDDEDSFRERAGDIAATVRCADQHGATGVFWFLGTAGADYEFAYELTLGAGTSQCKNVQGQPAIAAIYDGDGYQAFQARTYELMMANNPAVAAVFSQVAPPAPATTAAPTKTPAAPPKPAAAPKQTSAAPKQTSAAPKKSPAAPKKKPPAPKKKPAAAPKKKAAALKKKPVAAPKKKPPAPKKPAAKKPTAKAKPRKR